MPETTPIANAIEDFQLETEEVEIVRLTGAPPEAFEHRQTLASPIEKAKKMKWKLIVNPNCIRASNSAV